jgi:hypothetical protein
MQVAIFLARNGFGEVYNMSGGVEAWATQIDDDGEVLTGWRVGDEANAQGCRPSRSVLSVPVFRIFVRCG